METILIVDDEKDIAQALEYNLAKEGFKILKAHDGHAALRSSREKAPNIIILDLMLPGMSGFEVCRALKKDPKTSNIPIIMLTAKTGESDKIVGLELGADDYITKPFSMRELVARVKTVLRRYGPMAEEPRHKLKFSDLDIDPEKHEVRALGKVVELTAKEFALLRFLAENKEKVFGREKLLDTIWGIDVAIETRTVDVHVRRLREKLGKVGKHLVTLRGVGYKFKSDV